MDWTLHRSGRAGLANGKSVRDKEYAFDEKGNQDPEGKTSARTMQETVKRTMGINQCLLTPSCMLRPGVRCGLMISIPKDYRVNQIPESGRRDECQGLLGGKPRALHASMRGPWKVGPSTRQRPREGHLGHVACGDTGCCHTLMRLHVAGYPSASSKTQCAHS